MSEAEKPPVFPYKHGMEILLKNGLGTPTEDRVLLEAILKQDGSDLAKYENGVTIGDTLDAVCHRVLAVGPDVKRLKKGDMVIHNSAAADAADALNPQARLVHVREKYVVQVWSHEEALVLFEKLGLQAL